MRHVFSELVLLKHSVDVRYVYGYNDYIDLNRESAPMNLLLSSKKLLTFTFLSGIVVMILTIFLSSCSENDMNSEIVLIEEGDYMYPAKVTKTYAETDTQIEVYIFNDSVREKIGDRISTSKVAAKRPKPSEGWGKRQVAVQYFWNTEWIYSEDVTEFEDHYIIPMNAEENRKIELKHIRFPIPIQR